jgi:hypothetical protein
MRNILLSAMVVLALAGCAAAPAVGPNPPVLALEASFGLMARARGSAVPLAGGLVLTAAHVVDEASLREELCRLGRWPAEAAPYLAGLTVAGADGIRVPATRLRLGRSTFTAQGCDLAYRDGQDLALLRPAPPLQVPGVAVCAADPLPGQRVVAFSGGQLLPGRMAGEAAEAEAANGRYAVLALRLEPGDSGGGVFDAGSGCLLGVISMRDPAEPGRSWLVRAAVIRAFLATD